MTPERMETSSTSLGRAARLRAKVRAGELTVGSWLTIGHPAVAEILARAGYDWIVIDLEHSALAISQVAELIRTIDLCGVSPLVRMTSNDRQQIKRVLDAGAHGIVVPMVNSRAEAEAAVAATRYGPEGSRGVGLSRAQGYGTSFVEYLAWQREGALVIPQIEHRDAVACLPEILQTPGVDGFIVGPYDLSCSLGIPGQFDHPAYLASMAEILEVGRRLKVPAGLHIVEPDGAALERTIAAGYTFIAYSVDFRMVDVAARHGIAVSRALQATRVDGR